MITIAIADIETTPGTSRAVSIGRAIIDTLPADAAPLLLDNDGDAADAAQWSEMVQYLARRGIRVAYDHEAGYPVARRG